MLELLFVFVLGAIASDQPNLPTYIQLAAFLSFETACRHSSVTGRATFFNGLKEERLLRK